MCWVMGFVVLSVLDEILIGDGVGGVRGVVLVVNVLEVFCFLALEILR